MSKHLDNILLNSIFSVRQPGWFLHARADHSDINLKTVEFLQGLKGFQFHAVIGRKIPEIFNRKQEDRQRKVRTESYLTNVLLSEAVISKN